MIRTCRCSVLVNSRGVFEFAVHVVHHSVGLRLIPLMQENVPFAVASVVGRNGAASTEALALWSDEAAKVAHLRHVALHKRHQRTKPIGTPGFDVKHAHAGRLLKQSNLVLHSFENLLHGHA